MKIAFIGAGKMGLPVCKRLKAAGHDVKILARRKEQEEHFRELGFSVKPTTPALVQNADVIFTCVSDDKALNDVLLNVDFRTALPASATLIDMSTVSPSISGKIAAQLPQTISFLRSPVSGSTALAEAGTLTALVSGPENAFNRMKDIYAAFTRVAFHVGTAEEARYLKLAINSMVCATAALLGEALAFGLKGGLTHEKMLEVFTQSAVASPLIGYKKGMIISGDYTAAASLNTLAKDLDLFLDAAAEKGTPTQVNRKIREAYASAARQGMGEKDFFVLVQQAEEESARKS